MSKNKSAKESGRWLPENADWCEPWNKDWQSFRKEGFLVKKTLVRKKLNEYETTDYAPAQCVFCYTCLRKRDVGYFEPSAKVWVCPKCYEDFKDYFDWKAIELQ